MSNNKPTSSSTQLSNINEDILKKWIENEAKKIQLQEQRLALEENNQKRNYEYACKSLEVQKEIYKDKPREQRKTFFLLSIVGGFVLIALLLFFGYAIYKDKEKIVLEIVKYIGTAVLSFIGGTFYGKHRKESKRVESHDVQEFS